MVLCKVEVDEKDKAKFTKMITLGVVAGRSMWDGLGTSRCSPTREAVQTLR